MIAEKRKVSLFPPFLLCTDLNTDSAAAQEDNLKACHYLPAGIPLTLLLTVACQNVAAHCKVACMTRGVACMARGVQPG